MMQGWWWHMMDNSWLHRLFSITAKWAKNHYTWDVQVRPLLVAYPRLELGRLWGPSRHCTGPDSPFLQVCDILSTHGDKLCQVKQVALPVDVILHVFLQGIRTNMSCHQVSAYLQFEARKCQLGCRKCFLKMQFLYHTSIHIRFMRSFLIEQPILRTFSL